MDGVTSGSFYWFCQCQGERHRLQDRSFLWDVGFAQGFERILDGGTWGKPWRQGPGFHFLKVFFVKSSFKLASTQLFEFDLTWLDFFSILFLGGMYLISCTKASIELKAISWICASSPLRCGGPSSLGSTKKMVWEKKNLIAGIKPQNEIGNQAFLEAS